MSRPFSSHCRKGHLFSTQNTGWHADPKSTYGFSRFCIACKKAYRTSTYDRAANTEKLRKYRTTAQGKAASRRAKDAYAATQPGREKIRASNSRWQKAHPEKFKEYTRRHRERWGGFPSGTEGPIIKTALLLKQLRKELKS